MVFSIFRQFYFFERYISSRFFDNKPNEICSRLSEKGPKGRKFLFCAREAPKSRRRRKRKGEKERAKRRKAARRREKSNGWHSYSFYNGYCGDGFQPKKKNCLTEGVYLVVKRFQKSG